MIARRQRQNVPAIGRYFYSGYYSDIVVRSLCHHRINMVGLVVVCHGHDIKPITHAFQKEVPRIEIKLTRCVGCRMPMKVTLTPHYGSFGLSACIGILLGKIACKTDTRSFICSNM